MPNTTKLIVQKFEIMTKIKTTIEHKAAMERIEELLLLVDNSTPSTDKNLIELSLLSNLVADYEEEKYPITAPSLVEILKLRMFEMNLTQAKLSKLLNISASRLSEYLSGKSEPTLKIAREMSLKLNIDSSIVLGV